MTAETLKPFITTTSAEHFLATDHERHMKNNSDSNRQKNYKILPIALGVVGIVLGISLLGFTVWMTLRFNKLECEVDNLNVELKSLQKLVESIQNRLGLHYLDDLNEFKKEYDNALLENQSSFDEDKDMDEEKDIDSNESHNKLGSKYVDEEYEDYNDRLDVLAKQYVANMGADKDDDDGDDDDDDEEDEYNNEKSIQDKKDENTSDDDNFYDDFERYKDSKRKDRKIRSAVDLVSGPEPDLNKSDFPVDKKDDSLNEDRRVHHRHRSTFGSQNFVSNKNSAYPTNRFLNKKKYRSRKSRVIKSGDSLISVKSLPTANRDNLIPAAHFQLNRKIPHRHSALKIDSYNGDVYIGSPVWSNDADNFDVESGVLRTREPGLYYIYAQICYNNTYDHNGFIIFHGNKPFLQCLNTVPTHLTFKIHTCHTSGLIQLEENETIHLRDIHSDRDVVLKETNNRSFFGFMKIK